MSATGIRSRLVAVWLLLAALVGAIVVIEHTDLVGWRTGRASTADPRLLVPVPVDELSAIEVANAGRLHRFERDAAGAWFYHGVHTGSEGAHAHTPDPSAAQRIERALAALSRTRIERHLALDRDVKEYGVTPPRLLVLIYRPGDSQPLVQYAVGDIAPDTVSRYVQVVGRSGVVTIPNYQIDNLLTLIEAVSSTGAQTPAGLANRGPAGTTNPR